MNKKAQIAGQVFIFILAAALAALIIGYGYKAINTFTSRTEQIALINFRTDLQTEIRTIASDFGSVKRLDLNLPSDFKAFCMVDLNKRDQANTTCICSQSFSCEGNPDDYDPLICDAWTTPGTIESAFLVPLTAIKISPVEIEDTYKCFSPKGNKISLRIEGRGSHTSVKEWQN
ncbi:MAG: hypothetical protein V3V78_00560 [Candidatus Woesearchaeota archaeon]